MQNKFQLFFMSEVHYLHAKPYNLTILQPYKACFHIWQWVSNDNIYYNIYYH